MTGVGGRLRSCLQGFPSQIGNVFLVVALSCPFQHLILAEIRHCHICVATVNFQATGLFLPFVLRLNHANNVAASLLVWPRVLFFTGFFISKCVNGTGEVGLALSHNHIFIRSFCVIILSAWRPYCFFSSFSCCLNCINFLLFWKSTLEFLFCKDKNFTNNFRLDIFSGHSFTWFIVQPLNNGLVPDTSLQIQPLLYPYYTHYSLKCKFLWDPKQC